MSVTPLSQKEAIESLDAPSGTVPFGAGTTEPPENNAALDKVISEAVDKHYREDDPEPDKRGLDKILSENLDRAEAKEQDAESFKEALPHLNELGGRYRNDGDVVETLSRFVEIAKAAKADPRGIVVPLMEAYGRMGPWSPDEKPAEKASVYVDEMTGTRPPARCLMTSSRLHRATQVWKKRRRRCERN